MDQSLKKDRFKNDSENHISKQSKMGLVYALVVLFGNGVHPIINNTRPENLGGLVFSFYFSFWEFFCAIIYYSVLKKRKSDLAGEKMIDLEKEPQNKTKNALILLFICSLYSLSTVLYTIGLSLAGSVSGSIALKSAPVYSLIFGAVLLKEKIDYRLIFVIGGILTALIYLGTEGTFEMNVFSTGFAMLL